MRVFHQLTFFTLLLQFNKKNRNEIKPAMRTIELALVNNTSTQHWQRENRATSIGCSSNLGYYRGVVRALPDRVMRRTLPACAGVMKRTLPA